MQITVLRTIKVRPHYAARYTAAKCGKAARQKLRHATSICGRCVGMPVDAAQPKNSIDKLSVPSKEAARHLRNKGFQNGISQLEKKITPSSPISFHSFGNLKKVCKKCGRDRISGICLATFAARQSCSVLHFAARHSVDAPLYNTQSLLFFLMPVVIVNFLSLDVQNMTVHSKISFSTLFHTKII